jgi:hypothetical protein
MMRRKAVTVEKNENLAYKIANLLVIEMVQYYSER